MLHNAFVATFPGSDIQPFESAKFQNELRIRGYKITAGERALRNDVDETEDYWDVMERYKAAWDAGSDIAVADALHWLHVHGYPVPLWVHDAIIELVKKRIEDGEKTSAARC